MNFNVPITDHVIKEATLSSRGKVLVYRLNGLSHFAGCRLVTRRPIKRNGRWFIRDCGLVPLRAATRDQDGWVMFTT